MRTVIVDSGGANIGSVRYALARLGVRAELSADPAVLRAADKLILPGVGAAGEGMARLRERGLVDCVRALSQPVLGICLGMQLLFEASEEGGGEALGLIPGRVGRLQPAPDLRVPHMGWNRILPLRDSPLLRELPPEAHFYFVHGFAAPVNAATLAAAEHGARFAAAVQRDNFYGVQFHPERSGAAGARLLQNFLDL